MSLRIRPVRQQRRRLGRTVTKERYAAVKQRYLIVLALGKQEVFKRFAVTFAYKRQVKYLEKNCDLDVQGNWRRSGTWINQEQSTQSVMGVIEGITGRPGWH